MKSACAKYGLLLLIVGSSIFWNLGLAFAHGPQDFSSNPDPHTFSSAVQKAQQDLHHKLPVYFPEIHRITQQIARYYPSPEQHLLIGIGRGPSIFLTYFKLQHPSLASNIIEVPFSNFQRHWRLDGEDFQIISHQEEIFLGKYFQKFIVPHLTPDVKTITTIDYAQSGASLFTFTAWLRRFLQQNMPSLAAQIQWRMMAIAHWPLHPRFRANQKHFGLSAPLIIPLPTSSPLHDPLERHYFDQFAPWQEYPIDEYATWNILKSWIAKYLHGQNFSLEIPPRPLPNKAYYQVLLHELNEIRQREMPKNCATFFGPPTAKPPAKKIN